MLALWKCCYLPLERVASDAIFARNGNMPLEGKSHSELWGNLIKVNAGDLCVTYCLLKHAGQTSLHALMPPADLEGFAQLRGVTYWFAIEPKGK